MNELRTGTQPMRGGPRSFAERLLGAIKLDADVYEEVEHDASAMGTTRTFTGAAGSDPQACRSGRNHVFESGGRPRAPAAWETRGPALGRRASRSARVAASSTRRLSSAISPASTTP